MRRFVGAAGSVSRLVVESDAVRGSVVGTTKAHTWRFRRT